MLKWIILKRIWWFHQELVDLKVLRMVIQLEFCFFFLLKRQNDKCNVRHFRFLFGMSPDVSAFKVRAVFSSDFKIWFGVIEYSHSNSNFAHPFDFDCLINFAKISICRRWFLFGVSYYVNFQFIPWRVISA